MHSFAIVFLAALFAGTVLQWWLSRRHLASVTHHRAEVPAEFRDNITLDEHQKAADYTVAKVRFGGFEGLVGVVVLLWWTFGGGLEWLDGLWRAQELGVTPTGIGLILSMLLISGIIDLPFSLYSTFVLEERFGFNRSSVRQFIIDLFMQTALSVVIVSALVWAALALMAGAGTYWWVALWAVWTAFMLFMTWAYPTVIAPLFNKFTPLDDAELKSRIERLMSRCGFASNGIFVMDGSRRSGHGNAYFTGLGDNKRIVFFDTLLEQLSGDEIEAVLAHELGHFRRKHVTKRLLTTILLSLCGLALLGWLADQDWFYTALGVSQPSHYMALLLFMLVLPVFMTFLSPISSAVSRKHEFEADDYAAEQTDAADLIKALVKMYKENASTLTPDPLYSAFHDSHPPAPVRIAHLNSKLSAIT
ncbi:MAG TPA: M48 family peptidase [Chromatiaceae bacterium]|nr:M48 family peptidase [Chromatiaceae bacterium]HIN81445.1 M48 family peptidase [Chromatiales bacterium]HIA09161.1 M48 family peptidase [Chromatiaceae bacterium]HIB84819.1 M48 family peptidase [Chromatiaceae bacterium]HIO14468.1 M48 family peptidase [Chromatiales bacterium]